jgi:hypothetical protein
MKARTLVFAGTGAVLIAIAGGALYAWQQKPLLELGVGYGARVACGCRYAGNRPLEDCYRDFEPGMEPITLSEDQARKSVTASVPLIASRTVVFDPVLGCQPEPLER